MEPLLLLSQEVSRGFNDEAHQNRGIKRYADRIWDRATRYSDQAIGFYNGNAGTINTVLTVASLATGVGAFAAIGVNSLRIYYALSTTSLVTGIGANAFLPTTAGTVGNLTDATMAATASRFAVTSTWYGRATLTAYESVNVISNVLFAEAAGNE
jgi:hypothetical protein